MHTAESGSIFRLLRLAVIILAILALTAFVAGPAAAQTRAPAENTNSTPYLTPEEQLKTFDLKPGYRLELVVGDPIIKEPVVAVFDGNGRMYVAEMRTYMQDIDGRNQHTTNGVISLHWSSKRDGQFDRHTTFIAGLVLPRAILPLKDSVLVVGTGTDAVWRYWDENN